MHEELFNNSGLIEYNIFSKKVTADSIITVEFFQFQMHHSVVLKLFQFIFCSPDQLTTIFNFENHTFGILQQLLDI